MRRIYYDLNTSQKVLLYAQTYTVHKQLNNVCTSVLVDQELDSDLLSQAIKKAYERNDALGVRLVKKGKEIKQYFAGYEEPEIAMLDFTEKTEETMEKELYKIARKRITRYGKPLSKIYLLRSHDGRYGLYFVVSHMILDSWAISVFFKDVFAIYEALRQGTALPKPLYSYEKLLIEELNYRTTDTYQKDRKFCEEFFSADAGEPIFTHLNGSAVLEEFRKKKKDPTLRYAEVFTLNTKANNEMLLVPKELVSKMEAYCAAHKLTMQSLVLLAYRSFLSKTNNYEQDVSINTVIARRGTLREKNTGGTRVHFYPFRTIIEKDMTVKTACTMIGEKQAAIYRHASIDPLESLAIFKEKFNTPQLGEYCTSAVTFQPVKLVVPNGINIATKWYGNGSSAQPLYLTVMDGDGAGGLKFYYEYQTNTFSWETVKKLHSYMLKFFVAGTVYDDVTIGELLSIEP